MTRSPGWKSVIEDPTATTVPEPYEVLLNTEYRAFEKFKRHLVGSDLRQLAIEHSIPNHAVRVTK